MAARDQPPVAWLVAVLLLTVAPLAGAADAADSRATLEHHQIQVCSEGGCAQPREAFFLSGRDPEVLGAWRPPFTSFLFRAPQIQQGGQHPDTHVDGFVLRSAFIHVSGSDGSESVHRRMIQFDEQPHLNPDLDPLRTAKGRQLLQTQLPSFDANRNNRERVISLAKLNLLAYDRLNLRACALHHHASPSHGFYTDCEYCLCESLCDVV